MPKVKKVNSVRRFGRCIFVALLFFSAFLATEQLEAYFPGDTISHTYSHTYSGNPWGSYFVEVASWKDGSGCSYNYGNVFGPNATPNTPSSVSATCTFTAGSAGTTHVLKNWLQIGGGGWVDKGNTTYTISAPPVASADVYLANPSSMPVPYNSSVSIGVSYQNASNCNLYKSGSLYSGNVGVGNVGVGSLTSDTGFSLSCTANSNTTGTPSDSLTVTVAAPSFTVSSTGSGSGGTISPTTRTVTGGKTTTFTVTPGSGFVASASGCGGSLSGTTYTTGTITGACTVSASFDLASFTVTGSAGANGSISPSSRSVSSGGSTTFTITPNTGYSASASGCGGSLSGTTYTTGTITGACTVSATFSEIQPTLTSFVAAPNSLAAGGGAVTLTATANQNVGPTLYYITIYDGTTRLARCGSGTSCLVSPTVTGTKTFTAYVDKGNGTGAISTLTAAVTVAEKASQTITFAQPTSPATYNTTFSVSPTSSSGLAVSVTASGGCSISGSTVTMTSGSTACALTASQAGNPSFNAAADVPRTVGASKASNTITFGALANKTVGDPPFGLSASASSGLTVGFSSQTTGVCTVSGSTVTLVSAGTCTIRASQGGNTNYNAAPVVDRSFVVGQPPQTLTRAVSPASSGSISCNGTTCASSYAYNTVVNLSASPAANYAFSSWSGACTGATCSLTMNEAKSVTANFVNAFNYSLSQPAVATVLRNGSTNVTVSTTLTSGAGQGVTVSVGPLPSGVTAIVNSPNPQNPSASYTINFSANSAATLGTFAITLTGSPLNKTTTFNLTVGEAFTLTLNKTGSGSVTSTNINCGIGCSTSNYSYPSGTAVTLTATPASGWSVGSNSWTGCNSVSTNQGGQAICSVTMPAAKTVSVTFTQSVASASFTNPANNSAINYGSGTYFQWTSANTTGCSISVSPALSGYPKTSLPSSHSGVAYYSGTLNNSATFTLNCTPISGAGGSASATNLLRVNPLPTGNCSASFDNVIGGTDSGNWTVDVSGRVTNCPSEYFTDLQVGGGAGISPIEAPPIVNRVFDFAWWTGPSYVYDLSCNNRSYAVELFRAGYNAMPGPGQQTTCEQSLGGITKLHFLENLSGNGAWGSVRYESAYLGDSDQDYGVSNLPWGNYNFAIDNTFSGTYKCPDGDVPFNIGTHLNVCAYEPNDEGGRYYDAQCSVINPSRTSISLNCPSAPIIIVLDTPTTPTTPGTPLDFTNRLNVNSTKGGVSNTGVTITQIGNAVAIDYPGRSVISPNETITPLGGGNFGGVTNYSKTSQRAYKVTLEAPTTHPSGGSFVSWSPSSSNGCESYTTGDRRCTVTVSFNSSGGEYKTITADFSAVPPPAQPIITVGPGACDAKVNVAWDNATGATSYKLHRSTTGAPGSFSQLPFGSPTNVTSVFVDSRLTSSLKLSPNTTYHYQLEAVNAGGSSFSPITSGLSSKNCFDFGLTNGGNKTTEAGVNPVDNTLTASLTSEAVGATTQVVNLTMGSLPDGVTHSFLKSGAVVTSITPYDTITVRLNTTLGTTLPNTYAITITGTSPDPKNSGQTLTRTTTYNLTVTNPSNIQLSVTKSGTGTGTVRSSEATPRINCGTGSACSALYTYGDLVTLTPTPDAGSEFKQWTGACTGTGSCIVTMNGNKTVDAEFTMQIASVDLKAETSDGPITVDYDFNPKLTWSSTFVNANSCNIATDRQSNNFPKNGQPASMTAPGISTETLRQDVTFTITCTKNTGTGGGTGTTVTDSVAVKVKVGTGTNGPDVFPVTRANSCGVIDVTYQSAGNATTYTLHRNPDANGLNQWGRIAGGGTEATGVAFSALPPSPHTGLTAGTLYQYQLQAFNKVSDTSSPIRSATASANCFDYTLSNSGNVGIGVTGAASASVTKTLVTAPTQAVTLVVSSIKKPDNSTVTGSGSSLSTSGLTIAIRDNNPSNPTSTSNIDVTTNNATLGTYVVTVVGSPLGKSTSFNVTVSIGQPTITLNATTAACGANINLSYGGGSGANSFTLYRQIDTNTSPYPQRATATTLVGLPTVDTATVGTLPGLIPDRVYWYQVRASNGSFESYSPRVSATASKPCPTVDLTIDNVLQGQGGRTSRAAGSVGALRWTSLNAPANSICRVSWTNALKPINSAAAENVTIDVNTTYRIDCYPQADPTSLFSDTLTVDVPVTVTCSADPTSGTAGVTEITWTASPKGGTGVYTYSWSGTDSLTGTTISVKKTYGATSAGTKTAKVSVNGLAAADCSTSVNITAPLATADIKADTSDGPITVNYGATPSISWSSQNTATCSIKASPDVKDFPKNGISSTGVTTAALTADTTFDISCTPANGATNNPTDSVLVKVRPQAPDLTLNATAALCGGNINLSYTASANATAYYLHRQPYSTIDTRWGGIDGGADGGALSSMRTIDSGLILDAEYKYQLQAINANGSASSEIKPASASSKCFDYSLSNEGNKSVVAGNSVTNIITRTLAAGVPTSAAKDVTVSIKLLGGAPELPNGVTAAFADNPLKPTSTSNLTLSTTLGTTCPPPTVSCTYLITVLGDILPNKSTTFNLTVTNPSYLLTLNRTGNGSVSSNPAGITCNTGCATANASYLYNTSITLTATPDVGWSLSSVAPYGWTGCATTTAPNANGVSTCTITTTAEKIVSVAFTQLNASVDLQCDGDQGPRTLDYKYGCYFTWQSSFMNADSCTITNTTNNTTLFSNKPTSYPSGTLYYSGDRTSDATFRITCVKNAGTSGTNTDDVVLKVRPQQPVVNPSTPPPPTACGGTIDLGYVVSANATSYKLHRKPDANGVDQWGQIAGGADGVAYASLPSSQGSLTPGGLYQYQLQAFNTNGDSSSVIKSANASEKCFDYSLSTGGNISVTAGQSITNTVTRTLAPGVPASASENVTLTIGALPDGMTAPDVANPSFTSNPSKPTNTSTLTLNTTLGKTCIGTPTPTSCTYLVTINGSPLTKTTTFNLTVNNPSFALTMTTSGTGEGSVATSGITPAISCSRTNGTTTSGTCTGSYLYNTPVTLSASPDEGSTFDGWTGACSNVSGPCTVTMSQAKTVDAKFNQQNTSVSLTATSPVTYGASSLLTWASSNMQDNKCDLDATYNGKSLSGYPRKNLAKNTTNYSSGTLTQNPVVFTLTCTRVKGTSGPNAASATVGVLPEAMTPAPVGGTCGGTIALTYSGGTIATSFKLYRGMVDQSPYTQPANPPYTQIKNTAPGAPTDGSFTTLPATDIGLTPNTIYYYQVEAINTAGSSWSARPKSATASDNCFNYSLDNTGNVIMAVGSGGSTSITKTLIAGATAPVTLSVTSITAPNGTVTSGTTNTLTGSGMTVTISTTGNNNPSSPTNPATNPSTATITSTTAAQVGLYTVVVSGSPLGKTTSFTIDVGVAQPVVDASTTTGANACGGKITLGYSGGEGATLYELYRRPVNDGTPYELIQSAASLSGLRTTDSGLTYNGVYYYQVRAVNGTKESYSTRPKNATATSECPPIVNLEIEQADGSYSGDGTTSVVHGQSRMLRWTTTNASTCVAATIPNVPSGSVWGTNISITLPSESHTTGPITGVDDDSQPPVRQKEFRLTCQNSGGLATEVYDSVTVNITNIPTPDFSIVANPLTGVMNMYGPKGISSEFIITVEGQNNFTRDVVLDLELRTPSDKKENSVSFTLAPGDERLTFSEYRTGVGIKVNASNGLAGGKYNLIVTPLSDCNAQGQGCKKYDGTGGREDKTLSLPIQVTNVNPTFKEI